MKDSFLTSVLSDYKIDICTKGDFQHCVAHKVHQDNLLNDANFCFSLQYEITNMRKGQCTSYTESLSRDGFRGGGLGG